MNWILLLIVTINGRPAMTTISGFESKKECAATGKTWVFHGDSLIREYVCLEGPKSAALKAVGVDVDALNSKEAKP